MSDNYYQNNDSYSNNQSSTNKYSLKENQLDNAHYGETSQYNPYGQSTQSNSYYNQYAQTSQSGYQNSPYGSFQNDYYSAQQKTILNGGYSREASETAVREVLTNAYLYMFLGLLVTGIIAAFIATRIFENGLTPTTAKIFIAALVMEFPVVIFAHIAMKKNNVTLSYVLFFLYSAINGISFSGVLLIYRPQSVVSVFFICAAVFGIMTAFGALTKMDLSGIHSILVAGLIGLLIACLVNMFLKSEGLDYIITIVGVVVFTGLMATDTQKIKDSVSIHPNYSPAVLGLFGALQLYLDFLNLFLNLLRLLGKRR